MSKRLLTGKISVRVVIEKWGSELSKMQIYCNLCNKAVSFDNGGIKQISQHAKSGEHSVISKARFSTMHSRYEKNTEGKVTLLKSQNQQS